MVWTFDIDIVWTCSYERTLNWWNRLLSCPTVCLSTHLGTALGVISCSRPLEDVNLSYLPTCLLACVYVCDIKDTPSFLQLTALVLSFQYILTFCLIHFHLHAVKFPCHSRMLLLCLSVCHFLDCRHCDCFTRDDKNLAERVSHFT